ncbi:MAG: hypothetical protein H0T42_04040 [Deltaproteobacteria bacterium]|nr:hypothetical protein [Deltaproteobacteria bacterium]
MRSTVLLLAALCASMSSRAAHAEPDPTPTATVTASDGFLANAFAINSMGTKLAYVQVEINHLAPRTITLKIASLPGATEVATLTAVPMPEQLHWVSPDRLLLIEAVGKQQRAWSIPIAGPIPQTSIGPFDHISLSDVAGTPTIITYTRTKLPKVTTHGVASYAADDLRPLKSAALIEASGRVDHPDGKIWPLWWADGWSTLVGRRAGPYDKAENIRLPHQLVRLDVLAGSMATSELPIDGAFARLTAEQRAHPGQSAFVFRRGNVFQLVAGGNARPVTVARPASAYYLASLHNQVLGGTKLLFSITSQRRSKDPDGVEFYVADLTAGQPTKLLILPGKRKFVEWHAAGGRVAVLRKRQGAPGGPSIDIHDLPIK